MRRVAILLTLAFVATAGSAPGSAQPSAPSERDRAIAAAAAALEAGRRAEAARLFAAAAERFESVHAWLQLARIRSADGHAAGALEALSQARDLAPNSEEVLSAYAQVSLAARLPVAAILVLEPLTRMAPRVADYHYLLGVALMQAGDMEGSVEALREAERLDATRALTLVALGLALNDRKRHEEARDVLGRSLDLEPDSLDAVAALAEAEEGLNELEAAEAHARRVLARSSGHATANLVLGRIRMQQQRYAEARDAFQRAAAGDPTSPKADYQLSLAYARLGDSEQSEKHLASYRQKLREAEERIEAIRAKTGFSRGGMD